MFGSLIRTAYALVFPQYCPSCGEIWDVGRGWMCSHCWINLPPPSKGFWSSQQSLRNQTIIAFAYNEVTKILVHQMKFHGRTDIAEEIGVQTITRLQGNLDKAFFTCVVPVPLHPVRVRERGFDQNLIIARQVADFLDLPLRVDLIRRVKNSPPQSRLSDRERLTNLQDAFAPFDREKQTTVGVALLVDDVIHTGATVASCMDALKRAGIRETIVITAFG